jgi:hypothetical protein
MGRCRHCPAFLQFAWATTKRRGAGMAWQRGEPVIRRRWTAHCDHAAAPPCVRAFGEQAGASNDRAYGSPCSKLSFRETPPWCRITLLSYSSITSL